MFRHSLFWALLSALLIVLLGNLVLYSKIAQLPLPIAERLDLSLVLTWLLTGLLALPLILLTFKPLFKPVLALLLLATSLASYFAWTYGISIDADMIRNVAETDVAEVGDLLSLELLAVLALVAGAIWLLWRLPLVYPRGFKGMGARALMLGLTLVATLAVPWLQYDLLAGPVRNYRVLRHDVSPANWLVGSAKYIASLTQAPRQFQQLGLDAKRSAETKPKLVIMVVGETARAQNFGLDGYGKNTTPELAKAGVVNFSQLTSCGTATAISVPCMFSYQTQADFDVEQAKFSDNALDILARAGVKVLWRDNNSGCKDVCTRVPYQETAQMAVPDCDGDCLDMALLYQLDQQLPANPQDTLIVLHQKGSHGPAYYKRYPKAFEQFTPVCASNEPKDCTTEALVNSYDNSILYTDHVLAQVIGFLKGVKGYDTGMIYVSDHGESLGEYNLYLHGAPKWLAPDQQTHVPGVTWLSAGLESQLGLDQGCLKERAAEPHSQDDVFHSLLGIMKVKTQLYQADKDWYAPCGSLKLAANQKLARADAGGQ
ncbi:phosphoethanolamine transferase [Gallaecimonas xiamenensis]|uniref:Sulfatase n=1 Tax=Gallaecimonas xiamenensis 3-C-1 TaxID=745411 RepID=K2IQ99_9GAMM|nr:phosphoethanolamine--lipid A transferase [Gallaecimonas xiamenensis]EKE72346.1 hypothetical protein B3C1_10957 [Gallaecimonas xiamenensis 3-C-1]